MLKGGAESQDSCQPTSTGNVEYFDAGHGGRYSRHTPHLVYMNSGIDDYVAYAEFDIAAIPDSSSIMSVQFDCYQYEVIMMPLSTRCTYPGLDPDSASDSVLFSAVRNGVLLAEELPYTVGWVGYDLSTQGGAILRSCLPQDRITLGIDAVSGAGASYGITVDDKQTYLHVVYDVPGTEEPSGAASWRSEFAIAPNPTAGRFVIVRPCVPSGTRNTLTLRDVLGTAVQSFSPAPSGPSQLDLRGIAPGVYMATLDAGTQSLTRKLVITAR